MVKARTVGAVHTHTHTHTSNSIENNKGIKAFAYDTKNIWAIKNKGRSFNVQKNKQAKLCKIKHSKLACSFCA